MTWVKPQRQWLAKLQAFEQARDMLESFWIGILGAGGLALAAAMRPWRQLQAPGLWTPLLAALVLLPWFWALPRLHAMPLQLQWSGAVLVLLSLGWPLAVWALLLVSVVSHWLAPQGLDAQWRELFYLGWLPATLALGLGAAMRRWLPMHPFVYILGRGFLGTALCVFAASLLATWLEEPLPRVETGLSLIAQWLMAWGDAFLTGLMTAILVAFRPQWLATWSDPLYLRPPSE